MLFASIFPERVFSKDVIIKDLSSSEANFEGLSARYKSQLRGDTPQSLIRKQLEDSIIEFMRTGLSVRITSVAVMTSAKSDRHKWLYLYFGGECESASCSLHLTKEQRFY